MPPPETPLEIGAPLSPPSPPSPLGKSDLLTSPNLNTLASFLYNDRAWSSPRGGGARCSLEGLGGSPPQPSKFMRTRNQAKGADSFNTLAPPASHLT